MPSSTLLRMFAALILFLACCYFCDDSLLLLASALLLTPKKAAAALSISPRKLWGMTASGEIPHIRLGRCVRYPVDDLQRWIDDQKKGGQPT